MSLRGHVARGRVGQGPWYSRRGAVDAGFFSSVRRMRLLPGRQVDRSRLRGYYIDFTPKIGLAEPWPPAWLRPGYGHVALAQLALGHYERFLAEGSEASLDFARAAADHFVATQDRSNGAARGGWLHTFEFAHRAKLRTPWVSSMSQGQVASLLLRVYGETGNEELAECALLAMAPFRLPVERGGVIAEVRRGGNLFAEEYPTVPASHVLNGAIFALWGVRDVAETLEDAELRSLHEELRSGLAATAEAFDLGSWSRYDLFPDPPVNVSSSFYHDLHINQLTALGDLYDDPSFRVLAERFRRYQRKQLLRSFAFARKVRYRLVVPRHPIVVDSEAGSPSPRKVLKILNFLPIRRL
jgi:heparosan-N-sulfate-glucuronate 5-epimerase